tara:strand:- start:531 stop:689 length:159 start_codon:yes stop_codon:yes gene_type:complete
MIWRSCERFNLKPTNIKENFYDNDSWNQALLLAYNQIREYEEMEMASAGVKL